MDHKENPYALVPGETLSLPQLFDRYLDWKIWNSRTNRAKRFEGCDENLHHGFLCCQEHFDYTHESADFRGYFMHLTWEYVDSFSMYSMCIFIKKYNLDVDAKKVAAYFNITVREWATAQQRMKAQFPEED